jgi:uncharacterized protein YpmS
MSIIEKIKHNKRVLFILLSALIIAFIFIITLIALSQNEPGKTAFFARSINDASYDCEATITNKYDEKLIYKNYDDFSSRYEPEKHQYIIYYRISVREETDDRPTIKDYLAKCIVWERIGYVSDFSIIDY